MTAPKFSKGDRLRVVKDVISSGVVCLKKGDIHTATRTVPGWVSLRPDSGVGEWIEDRFELYAKAGEFVVGDRAVWNTDEPSQVFKRGEHILIVKPRYDAGSGTAWATNLEGGGPWWFRQEWARLATPEEIKADLKPSVPFRGHYQAVDTQNDEVGLSGAQKIELSCCATAEQAEEFIGAAVSRANLFLRKMRGGDEVVFRIKITDA